MKVAQGLSFPRNLMDLLSSLLEVTTRKRLTTAQILAHPWMKGNTLTQSELSKSLSEKQAKALENILRHGRHPGKDKRQELVFRDALDSAKKKTLAEAIQKALEGARKGLVKPVLLPSSFVGGAMRVEVPRTKVNKVFVTLLESLQKMQPSPGTLGETIQDRLQVVSVDVGSENAPSMQIEVRNGESTVEVEALFFSDGVRDQPETPGAEKRVDTSDNKAYTLAEFKTMYGPFEGEDIWKTAPEVPSEGSIVVFQRLNGTYTDYGHVLLRLKRALLPS